MTYAKFEDVALMVGAQPQDFNYLGEEMTLPEYQQMVETMIEFAELQINRYCNVETFQLHEIEDELHSITNLDRRGTLYGWTSPLAGSIYDLQDDYSENARTILPREYPCYQVESVSVSFSAPSSPKVWKELQETTETQAGDYNVVKRFNHTHITIGYNLPRFGINNCKISYQAGYPPDHAIFSQLKMATVMIVRNILNYKKASQEAYTIRGASVSDYSQMFGGYDAGGFYLSNDVRMILDKWRRPYSTPDAYV